MEDRLTNSLEYAFDRGQVAHPVVSVIVTNFNYTPYVEQCLRSIAAQSYRHFECVVVDDASTDDSVAVIERFSASALAAGHFRLVRHAQNDGQMAAFQTGLEQTRGSFVVFVDADDLLFPDFIETHLKAHLNSARVAAFTCSELMQIASDGQVLSGIQGLAGTPELRSSRCNDGHQWTFSPTGGLAFQQSQLPMKYYGPWEVGPTAWIWSTTSATMFRRAVLDVIMSPESRCLRISADRYLFNFSHGIGGSLLIRTVHGCYRRHGANWFSGNPVIGGDSFLGDLRKDPAGVANVLIFRHVLQHYDQFCRLLGRSFTIGLLRHFGPRKRLEKLILAARTWYRMKRAGLSVTSAPSRAVESRLPLTVAAVNDKGNGG